MRAVMIMTAGGGVYHVGSDVFGSFARLLYSSQERRGVSRLTSLNAAEGLLSIYAHARELSVPPCATTHRASLSLARQRMEMGLSAVVMTSASLPVSLVIPARQG